MKSIAITTIICGTALILAPIIQNTLTMYMVANLMAQFHEHVDMTSSLSTGYWSWCMFIGVCTIISGLLVGLRLRGATDERPVISAAQAAPSIS